MPTANAKDDRQSVFISHSAGDRGLADALRDLLQKVLPEITINYSSQHEFVTTPGTDFFKWFRETVQSSMVVFVVLTRESLRSSWLSFEAGVAASTGDARIVPIAFQLDVTDVPAPFQRFQIVRGDDHESVMRLVGHLVSEEGLRRGRSVLSRLDMIVREFIERVQRSLEERSSGSAVTRQEARPRAAATATINDEDAQMLCELLFRMVVKLRERPEMLQSVEPTAFWAAVRKIRPSASNLDDLRAINADLTDEPAPGPLWVAWIRHVRATELAAVVQNPGVTRNPA